MKFLSVGLFIAILYISFFNFLWKFLSIEYHVAFTISYIVAIVLHFYLSRVFTFQSKNHDVSQQFFRFLALIIFNYMITLTIVHSIVSLFVMQPSIGIVIAILVNTVSNYLIAKFWIFSSKRKEQFS